MVSTFEAIMQCDPLATGRIGSTLRKFLDDGSSLHRLRKTSRTAKEFVDGDLGRLFDKLYVRTPFRPDDRISTLIAVASHCTHLVVQVGMPADNDRGQVPVFSSLKKRWTNLKPSSRASVPKTAPEDTESHTAERRVWTKIFRKCCCIASLTLRITDDTASVSNILLTLRLSLEAAEVSTLRTLLLSPVHGSDILHLRWSSFGAFESCPTPQASRQLWLSITTLEIHLHNSEQGLSFPQSVMRTKTLQSYLRSFSKTVQCLKFMWLDGNGPSPLLLDEEAGMEGQEPLFWPVLEEVWLGGMKNEKRTGDMMRERAPRCRTVKFWRSTRRDQGLQGHDGAISDEAWREIDVDKDAGWSYRRHSTSSSVYSQSEVDGRSSGESSRIAPLFEGVRRILRAEEAE